MEKEVTVDVLEDDGKTTTEKLKEIEGQPEWLKEETKKRVNEHIKEVTMSKQLTKTDELKLSIQKLEPQIQAALPAHIPVKKFSRVLMTAVSTTPNLANADRNSIFASCLKLAQMGLLPDSKEAAIVTFRTKDGVMAQAMPMISGILKLVRNSGELSSLSPHVVYSGDEFDYFIDEDGEHLRHRPNLTGDRGEITHAYAMAKMRDGSIFIEVMSKQEIDKVRESSRAKTGGPWSSWYGEMAKKTVLRRLAKRLPMSTDLDTAIAADDDLVDIAPPLPSEDVDKPVKNVEPTKPQNLKKLVKNHAPGADEDEKKFAPPSDAKAEDELPI